MNRRAVVVVALASLLTLAACTSKKPSAGPTPEPSSPSPSASATSPSPTPSPSPSAQPTPKPTPKKTTPKPKPKQPKPKPPAPGFSLSKVKISLSTFVSGLTSPVFITHAGDGSGLLYVVEQPGRIRVYDSAGHSKGTFLDISGRVTYGGEQGLLGLAFHPGFKTNRRFFVDYTDSNGDDVVSEFHATSTTSASAISERKVLTVQDFAANHNGGMLAFGHDGFLYIAMGDGGGGGDPQNNGQDVNALLGKILRINVNAGSPYSSPSSNPFVGRTGRDEIWSYGWRNPWRFSFDRSTHAMFIGDVGQNAWEEVDVEAAGHSGRNYGWRVMEGRHCYNAATCNRTGKVVPIVEYSHDFGCAVTGGYVYRGTRYSTLKGAYFYADYCSGRIWAMDAAAALKGTSSVKQVLDTGYSISSFGEDGAGELFVVDLGGRILKLRAA